MGGTAALTMGDRGRLVIPADLRARKGWRAGTPLVAIETDAGIVLAAREDLEALVRRQLAGRDVVGELIEERRAAAASEDQT